MTLQDVMKGITALNYDQSLLVIDENILTESLLNFTATSPYQLLSIFVSGQNLILRHFHGLGEPQFLFAKK
jgi:hypothetical protein